MPVITGFHDFLRGDIEGKGMSQHFVTVCVVCVLCAAHTPCSAHTDLSALYGPSQDDSNHLQNSSGPSEQLQPLWFQIGAKKAVRTKDNRTLNSLDGPSRGSDSRMGAIRQYGNINNNQVQQYRLNRLKREVKRLQEASKILDARLENENARRHNLYEESIESSVENQREILERLGQVGSIEREVGSNSKNSRPNENSRSRTKRGTPVDEQYFLKKVFDTYGDGSSMTMAGFEKLLQNLGLFGLETEINEQEVHSIDSNQAGSQADSIKNSSNGLSGGGSSISTKRKCLSSKDLLAALSQNSSRTNNSTVPEWLFKSVCPALVWFQLVGKSGSERTDCVRAPESFGAEDPILRSERMTNIFSSEFNQTKEEDEEDPKLQKNMFEVWLYSTISIVIISLCGLLGVAVIPVMGKSYYHQLLQFLVALAVGTLCGDALIHLLPHAMMPAHEHGHEHGHEHDSPSHESEHNANMWKGLVAMMGLVLFFFTEKGLTMVAEWRKHRQRRNKLPLRVRVMREQDGSGNNTVGEKLCKHKYSSYPYCYGEITTETQDNHHNRHHNNHQRPPAIEEEKPLTSNCNSVSKIMETNREKEPDKDGWIMNDPAVPSKPMTDGTEAPLSETESYTVIIREHETKHHGHTHSHGHVHSAPDSMSSVAWMVVMGDGLHNFTDGMAIGAAFSANIAGGFSTAIAVFCHELPHELGDFAVLLKAGMSAKQAVFYNMLSSVLCLFGMVFGVLLGAQPSATSWIFAAAAGMFIYIALVDMIPELTSSHSAEGGSQWQCLLQALGLAAGLGIMLVIAIYEHDLKNIFSK